MITPNQFEAELLTGEKCHIIISVVTFPVAHSISVSVCISVVSVYVVFIIHSG